MLLRYYYIKIIQKKPIPKFDGSCFADVIWPQETFENKDEIGEVLLELLCTDKLLPLPCDEKYKDALVIDEKGEKVVKYLFEAIEYACYKGGIEYEWIAQTPKPFCYYVSDFFERSVNMKWATVINNKKVKYSLSKEFCRDYQEVFGKGK